MSFKPDPRYPHARIPYSVLMDYISNPNDTYAGPNLRPLEIVNPLACPHCRHRKNRWLLMPNDKSDLRIIVHSVYSVNIHYYYYCFDDSLTLNGYEGVESVWAERDGIE